MDASGKNRSKNNPQIHAWAPKCAAQCAENRSETRDVQKLDHKHLPGRKRNIINSVQKLYCRSRVARRLEYRVDKFTVDKIADYQSRQSDKK